MNNEQKTVMTWLKKHGVKQRVRRYAGTAWIYASRIAGGVEKAIGRRIRFISALLMGFISALLLGRYAIIGKALAGLCMIVSVIVGLVAELKAEILRRA